jgi:uncharacterized protein YxjI
VNYRIVGRLLSMPDHFTVYDAQDRVAYRIVAAPASFARKLRMLDCDGNLVLLLESRQFSVLPQYRICDHMGTELASLHCKVVAFRSNFYIESPTGNLDVAGSVSERNYALERCGRSLATVHRRFFTVRDTYEVEVAPGENAPLLISCALLIDSLAAVPAWSRGN